MPLPEAHLFVLATATVLHLLVPRSIASPPIRRLGWAAVTAGAALAGWATHAAGGVDLDRPDQIVERGPYAFSRHPMYLAWTSIYVGASLVAGTGWPFRLLPVLAVLVDREARREERRLISSLGSDYQRYRDRVRRYL